MPKNKFAKLDETFKEVAEASAKKANVYTLINISNADLIDYPKNQEDIENTADIENSINEVGFIDPIEVTNYGQPDGKFMIISGHRRRAAGVKCCIEYFPCIARHFESDEEVYNYVLLSNSHRDSSKDPLLYCKRYKMHEDYLNKINFTGNYRTEISKRLGISKPQADRYNAMNKIILPVWDMVRDEIVSVSGVFPLASHTHEEQEEIVAMMNEHLDSGGNLNRDTIKILVEAYRNGKASPILTMSTDSEDKLANANQEEYKRPVKKNIGDVADKKVASINHNIPLDKNKNENNHYENDDDTKKITEAEDKNLKKTGQDIISYLENINTCFHANPFNGDKGDIELIINRLTETFEIAINGMQRISKENNLGDVYDKFLKNVAEKIHEKINNR